MKLRVMLLIACAMLVSCQKDSPQETYFETSPTSPAEQPAEIKWSVANGGSEVVGKVLKELPRAPANTPEVPDGMCADYVMSPKTAAGEHVANLGWHVREEIAKNDMTYVSFFSQSTGGTSGNCDIHDGNVAVFDGDQFIADIYASKKSKQPLGTILDGKQIRIYGSSVVGTPMADVSVDRTKKLITIRNIPDVELSCNGKVKVPNIHDMEISNARKKLKQFGWLPSDMSEEADDFGMVKAMADAGHKEYSSCSGTGFGFCNLEYYNGENGMTVTTYGEESATVNAYEVHCAK